MVNFCVGLGVLFLLVCAHSVLALVLGKPNPKFSVEGFFGFVLVGALCYGLGTLTLALLGVK